MKFNLFVVIQACCDNPDDFQTAEDIVLADELGDAQCDSELSFSRSRYAVYKALTLRDADKALYKAGWRQDGRLTLCPKCAERRGIK